MTRQPRAKATPVTPPATETTPAPVFVGVDLAVQPDTTVTQEFVLVVTGPRRGRWRAGRHFTDQPTRIPLDDLTEIELDALRDDPALTATIETPAA